MRLSHLSKHRLLFWRRVHRKWLLFKFGSVIFSVCLVFLSVLFIWLILLYFICWIYFSPIRIDSSNKLKHKRADWLLLGRRQQQILFLNALMCSVSEHSPEVSLRNISSSVVGVENHSGHCGSEWWFSFSLARILARSRSDITGRGPSYMLVLMARSFSW